MHWRTVLPNLIADHRFQTQSEIVRALERETGLQLNQATISRELATIGAQKIGGVYRLAPAPDLGVPIRSFQLTAAGCLVVVKTEPAFANVIGQAIDGARLAGVFGTLAGDDTVFVALEGETAAMGLRRFLGLGSEGPGRR
ncbi:MAG: arginine repressor [Deltaproteobacteria bacterium]|nr:arginine repressor [Deltaproteobacteria bacterium]MBW2253773.1 arginine repressor [Deltaproteobacteria bacterium]